MAKRLIDTLGLSETKAIQDEIKQKYLLKIIGKNKLNINDENFLTGKYISASGNIGNNSLYAITNFIEILEGDIYVKNDSGYGGSVYTAYYDEKFQFITGSAINTKTIPYRAGAKYFRSSVRINILETLQIELGLESTEFVKYIETYRFVYEDSVSDNSISSSHLKDNSVTLGKIADSAVKESNTNFFEASKNLFNPEDLDVATGFYVAASSGNLVVNASYNTTGYISVIPGEVYTRSYGHQSAFYDENKNYISGLAQGSGNTFITPANAVYVRCTVSKSVWETFQIESGNESTSFEPFGFTLKSKYIPQVIDPDAKFINSLITPQKQYLLSDYENTIYYQSLTKRYRPQDEFVRIEGGEWVNKKHMARITSPALETANVNAKIYNIEFKPISSDGFDVVIGDIAIDNGLVRGIYVGDSLSYNGSYILKVNSLIPNISWDGMRKSYSGNIYGEGRGGWKLSSYFESLTGDSEGSFTPFMHPVNPYKYFGGSDFWKAVVNGASGYSNANFLTKATEIGFDAATGLLINPAVDDCMYNNSNARYERWNGSSWIEITAATLNFSFNFAKYRSTWNITQPDVVTVMLGTNDFRSQPSESTIDGFWNEWQTRMETFAASVIADNPSAKFAILIPPTTCGSMDNVNGAFTMMQNAMMWYGRKLIIENFDKREAEGIYLVDVGRSIDPEYGFDEIEELPFSDYAGTSKRIVHGNPPHPNTAGYSQLAIPLAGWIQKVR